jgi:hypothetical protein
MNLFFTGGGILGMFYYAGMIRYIRDSKVKVDKVYGVSAGAAIGMCLLLDIDIAKLITFMENTAKECLNVTEIQMKGVSYVLDQRPDAYKILTKRLYIGLSCKDGFRYKSRFKSNLDLANAIMATSCIPLLSSWKSKYIDGSIAFNPKNIQKDLIVMVCKIPFPLNMFIPPKNMQSLLIENGYRDAKNNIKTKNNDASYERDMNPMLLQLCFFLHDVGCLINPKTIKDLGKL